MKFECGECKHQENFKCKFGETDTLSECSLYEKREYSSKYVNRFDIQCRSCGHVVVMPVKGVDNYCRRCGNKL